jgi:NitT/TauT family transport system permease protein
MRVSSSQLWSLGPEALAGSSRWAGLVVRYSPLLIIAVAWELAARLPLLPARVLPPFSEVLDSWVRLAFSGELVTNGLDSLYRLGLGLFLAVFVGTAAGLLMETSRSVNVFIARSCACSIPCPNRP